MKESLQLTLSGGKNYSTALLLTEFQAIRTSPDEKDASALVGRLATLRFVPTTRNIAVYQIAGLLIDIDWVFVSRL